MNPEYSEEKEIEWRRKKIDVKSGDSKLKRKHFFSLVSISDFFSLIVLELYDVILNGLTFLNIVAPI